MARRNLKTKVENQRKLKAGVSRAMSTLGPVLDSNDVLNLDNVGMNPMHEKNLNVVKNLSRRKRYKFSKILRDITKNRNLGINVARNLFLKKVRKKSGEAPKTKEERASTPKLAWLE